VKNTMNCISTLFLPRNRQISIPKPQAFMEVPQKFSAMISIHLIRQTRSFRH
jgi:hypothetical protein